MKPEIKWYKLIGKLPVPCSDLLEWAAWRTDNENACIVKQDHVGPLFVSTVFLSLDHNYSGEGDPLLFETMIFGIDPDDSYQTRCTTWDQAELMHEVAMEEAQARYERALKALEKREAHGDS